MWQTMIGEMEKGFNSFANQAMASPEFSKVDQPGRRRRAGAQKQLGELMEKYLVSMNLPSRAQMVSMAERLQSIEGQLNEIKALLYQVHHNSGVPTTDRKPRRNRRAPSGRLPPGRTEMNATCHALDLDVDSGADPVRSAARDPAQHQGRRVYRLVRPGAGVDAEGHHALRGTMNLYHYRPMADEIYRVPILIVMATTNRGYILDMVPGQSLIEFLLKRGYDVYMLDWNAPKPEEKNCGWRTTCSTSFRNASAACSRIPARPMSP